MTEKRFIIIGDDNIEFLMQDKLLLPIYDNGMRLSLKGCCDLLNEQYEGNMLLIDDSEKYRKLAIQFDNRNKELVSENALLEKENKQLKQQIKELRIENEAQSDAIDGLQGFITHFDLEEVVK